MKPYVVYWNNIPAPYMVERFNQLAKRDDIEFEAWFNERREPDRSWEVNEASWEFKYKYVKTVNLFGKKIRIPFVSLKNRPDVIISLYAEPVFLFGWMISKLLGIKTIFWCQVTHDSWVKRKWWKESLKRLIFPHVDRLLGSGEESREFAMRYGVKSDRAIILRHSIDVDYFNHEYERLLNSRGNIRKSIGVQGITFIYVGRLWWGKGLDYLLKAFSKFQATTTDDVSLIIVGDGVQERLLKELSRTLLLKNVIFAGFQHKSSLPKFYIASDVFVFPTLGDPYGLVVDEAMACHLPVISSSAAGEISDRVIDGYNGYIFSPKSIDDLEHSMKKIVEYNDLELMATRSADLISGHTSDKWAIDFSVIIRNVLNER